MRGLSVCICGRDTIVEWYDHSAEVRGWRVIIVVSHDLVWVIGHALVTVESHK